MELLSYPKTEYLLSASLHSLHAESLKWLDEIDFWNDEMSFFHKILMKTRPSNSFPGKELAEIQKELIGITGEKLVRLRSEVASHECMLASLFKSPAMEKEGNYRQGHRVLQAEIHSFHILIKSLKKRCFLLSKTSIDLI